MTQISQGKGVITMETEGLPQEEVERLMRILDIIVRKGVLSIRSSFMTIHFDDQGEVGTVERMVRDKIARASRTPL